MRSDFYVYICPVCGTEQMAEVGSVPGCPNCVMEAAECGER